MFDYDDDAYVDRRRGEDPGMFWELHPGPNAGDGLVVANNRRTGAGQGRGSLKRKVRCKQCGFFVDLNRKDASGGNENGDDFTIAKSAPSGTTSRGDTISDVVGDSDNKGGCGNCGSRNPSNAPPQDVHADIISSVLRSVYV